MPILIVNESYNGEDSLIANAGNWVDGEMNFSVRFAVGSSSSSKITWKVSGSNMWFQLQQGDFGVLGFLAGDTVTASYTFTAAPSAIQAQSINFTVDYISGNKMFVTAPFTLNPIYTPVPAWAHIDGRQFPTDNYVGNLSLIADRPPASVEFEFNLTPNGSTLLNSLIDSELNRFERVLDQPTLVVQPMTQFVNKSGGLLKDVDITLMATPGQGWRDYRIRYKFFQWGIIQDGFTEPNYYDLADCLAPINKVKCFAQYGNPNGVMIDSSDNIEANTGGYDENFNGAASLYTSLSTSWVDLLGDPIDKLDFSNKSTFTAIIDAPGQVNPTSTYRIGLAWRPIDGTYYQNKLTNLGENLLVIAPEIDFIANGVADPTIYLGYEDENGARWDFQNLKFELTGVDELTVSGDIIPNALATTLFEGVPDGGRRSTLWVDLGDYTSDGTIYSKRVSLKIFDEDNYDAPTVGIQIANVIDEVVLDHAGNVITTPLPQTTTEDDVLYISNFNLLDNLDYEGVRARIYAFNTGTDEAFTLEDIFFNFANVPFIAGQFQPNFINPRGFNLPPTTDRNHISLVRNPLNDVPGQYGLTLEYGYLSRWEYWLSQPNVDNDFFDITEPLDGKNKNWQRFSNSGDWVVRLSYYTRLDGVDDFNDFEVGIRPYEDDPDVSFGATFEIESSGVFANDIVVGEVMEVVATIPWATGTYTNPWAEIIIEDFESGNTWWLSSVLPQGNITSNPLKPIAGEVGLQITHPAVNVAVLTFRVDGNLLNAAQSSLSYRIYSDDVPYSENILTVLKDAEIGISVRKIADDAVYSDASPCMKVRRSSDNVELDIGFVGTPLALNVGTNTTVGSLLWHVTKNDTESENHGYVTKWYDQSGNSNDGVQTSGSQQPLIVDTGLVTVDPNNGLPAVLFDGANDFMNLTVNIQTSQLFYESWVMNRASAGILSIALSAVGVQPHAAQWKANNNIVTGMGTVRIHSAGDVNTGDFLITTRRIAATNDIYAYRNGVALANFINTVDVLRNFTNFGSTGGYHDGHMQELIYYKKDKTADQSDIETNTNDYYSIY